MSGQDISIQDPSGTGLKNNSKRPDLIGNDGGAKCPFCHQKMAPQHVPEHLAETRGNCA